MPPAPSPLGNPPRHAGLLRVSAFFAATLTFSTLLAGTALQAQSQVPSPKVPPRPVAQSDNAPAPIVRVRPHSQTAVPTTAPPEAAPLVTHPVRPKPVNPQTLNPVQAAPPTSSAPPVVAPERQHTLPAATSSPSSSAAGTEHAVAATSTPAKPTLSTSSLNRSVIAIDPAHGGTDSGSRIGDKILEKDVTLALAFRLRSLLTARGFTIDLTRDSDAATAPTGPSASAPVSPLTLDDRAGISNRAHAAACLLLHATGRGTGVHLYSSELDPAPGEVQPTPWLTAQAAWIPASQQMERSLSAALGRSHLSLISSTASVRPLDSMNCPALIIELAPEGSDPQSILDAGYQDRVATALAGALVFWQNQVQPPAHLGTKPAAPHPVHHHTVAPATPRQTEVQP